MSWCRVVVCRREITQTRILLAEMWKHGGKAIEPTPKEGLIHGEPFDEPTRSCRVSGELVCQTVTVKQCSERDSAYFGNNDGARPCGCCDTWGPRQSPAAR